MRYTLPLPDWLARKFDALERQLDYRVLASADQGSPVADERFRLLAPSRVGVLDGVLFYLRLPFHVRREIIDFRPEAIIAESPYMAAAALVGRALGRGRKPQVVVEVHGDWRTATRLYGSPSAARALAARRRGRAARAPPRRRGPCALALHVGLVEEVRGRPATASFHLHRPVRVRGDAAGPLPERPTALFVGMLERTRTSTARGRLATVVRELPEARLVIVGRASPATWSTSSRRSARAGRARRAACRPEVAARWTRPRARAPVPAEGLGASSSRPSPAGAGSSRAGSAGSRTSSGRREALLVEPGDADALAEALVRALSDRALAERLGSGHAALPGVGNVAGRVRRARRALVDETLAGGAPLMRLIFVTQRVDAEDPFLGATVAKLGALAPLRRARS